MGLFSRQSVTPPPQPPTDTTLERLDRLESALRMLQGEWEDTYERIMRALRRLNKRAQDQAAREEKEAEEAPQLALGSTINGQPGLDPISAQILARRARALQTGHDGGR